VKTMHMRLNLSLQPNPEKNGKDISLVV